MENQKVKEGWSKASMVLGIIAMVIALLPLMSGWFLLLMWINYLVVPAGVICGVIALIKSQNMKKTIIGLALCVVAFSLPYIMAESYVESVAESAAGAINSAAGAINSAAEYGL